MPADAPSPAPFERVPSERAAIERRLRAAGCVFAEEEAGLILAAPAARPDGPNELVARRVAGEPLEHLLGWVDFHGLRVAVDPGLFVPRRRTELLVDIALESVGSDSVVLDLCCGCGAVGTATATAASRRGDRIALWAADLDPRATDCARRNLEPLGAVVVTGDLFDPLPAELRGRVDVLTVNAPYVPTAAIAEMPPEARLHEPLLALDGGTDGLDVLRRVLAQAPGWLAPNGLLLAEIASGQADLAVGAARVAGLPASVRSADELGSTVLVTGRGSLPLST